MQLFTVTVEWEDLREGQWVENLRVAAFDMADAERLARAWLEEHQAWPSDVKIQVAQVEVPYAIPVASHGVIGHLVLDETTGQVSWEAFGR